MANVVQEYKTIENICEGEITEKKSRFIATVYPVESEEAAIELIEAHKKKYWDARHNCYAYIIGKNSELMRFSDDGEPSGTAGKPILEVIKGSELTNVLVVVTRYFGGVLLGTGGLVRAYSSATLTGIAAGRILTVRLMHKYCIRLDYSLIGKIKYFLNSENIEIVNEIYESDVAIEILVTDEKEIDKLIDTAGGKLTYEKLEADFFICKK